MPFHDGATNQLKPISAGFFNILLLHVVSEERRMFVYLCVYLLPKYTGAYQYTDET